MVATRNSSMAVILRNSSMAGTHPKAMAAILNSMAHPWVHMEHHTAAGTDDPCQAVVLVEEVWEPAAPLPWVWVVVCLVVLCWQTPSTTVNKTLIKTAIRTVQTTVVETLMAAVATFKTSIACENQYTRCYEAWYSFVFLSRIHDMRREVME